MDTPDWLVALQAEPRVLSALQRWLDDRITGENTLDRVKTNDDFHFQRGVVRGLRIIRDLLDT